MQTQIGHDNDLHDGKGMTMLKTSGCYTTKIMPGTHSNVQENEEESARKCPKECVDVGRSGEEVI